MIKVYRFDDLAMAWVEYCCDYRNMADFYNDMGMLVEYI